MTWPLSGEWCKCGHAAKCHDADPNGCDSVGEACAHCDCQKVDRLVFSACGAVWFPGMDLRPKKPSDY